nr:hypothetical protein [Frankia gtarii]
MKISSNWSMAITRPASPVWDTRASASRCGTSVSGSDAAAAIPAAAI